jgi:hypothetical protein
MAQFKVEIARTSYGTKTFFVEANTKGQAKAIALDIVKKHTFDEDDAD